MAQDDTQQENISAFEKLVERAEAAASTGPRADLAGYQLQALTTTVGQLAAGGPVDEVSAALATVRAWIADHAGLPDELEGRALRQRVAAYATLADELGLDADHLEDLAARWDAATARTPVATPGRRGPGRPRKAPIATFEGGEPPVLQECPVCGQPFKRVSKHMSSAHPAEWRALRNEAGSPT